ncbi:GNAT family N-acetyltransferase [Mariniphaga sp.]|uniref:GNAT family N-acetyltransferase n=1 Tax=Mariniphaga sp. TaxID=1954475 RepID=UPI00356AEDEF
MDGKSNCETLNPEIRKIRLDELGAFIQSDEFRQFSHIPISYSRAKSYLENPKGNPGDVVLILALLNNKLVAFRSLFADEIQTEKEKIRFGWCSGNWVHPDFRRKGISKLLLEAAYSAWNGKLMFTNYAPESEKLYLKTGWFRPIHQFEGVRAYLFPKTGKLLAGARRNRFSKWIFSLVDFCIASYSNLRINFFRQSKNAEIQFEIAGKPDEETLNFAEKFRENFVFGQGEKALKWIFDYPWISDENREVAKKYPFSSCSNAFRYHAVKIWQQNEWRGVFIFSVRDGQLKTLFFWNVNGLEKELAQFLKWYSVKHKLEMLTVYHPGVSKLLLKYRFPFLHVRKYGQKIYSSFDIPEFDKIHFQDGEGDVVFT